MNSPPCTAGLHPRAYVSYPAVAVSTIAPGMVSRHHPFEARLRFEEKFFLGTYSGQVVMAGFTDLLGDAEEQAS